jgi:hypothetical protein
MAGFLTRKCYKYACMFLSICIHDEGTNCNKALDAKQAFKAYLEAHGMEVKCYHADNGTLQPSNGRRTATSSTSSLPLPA